MNPSDIGEAVTLAERIEKIGQAGTIILLVIVIFGLLGFVIWYLNGQLAAARKDKHDTRNELTKLALSSQEREDRLVTLVEKHNTASDKLAFTVQNLVEFMKLHWQSRGEK